MKSPTGPHRWLWAILLISTATILTAWAFQLIAGYPPCPLCLQQRWPYYATIALAVLLLWLEGRRQDVIQIGLLLIALIMIAGAILGAYHAGIEWKLWQGPQACSAGGGLSGALPDLSTARIVRCDEAAWRFLGLSFAGWNVLISLFVAALALLGARSKPHGSSSVSQ